MTKGEKGFSSTTRRVRMVETLCATIYYVKCLSRPINQPINYFSACKRRRGRIMGGQSREWPYKGQDSSLFSPLLHTRTFLTNIIPSLWMEVPAHAVLEAYTKWWHRAAYLLLSSNRRPYLSLRDTVYCIVPLRHPSRVRDSSWFDASRPQEFLAQPEP